MEVSMRDLTPEELDRLIRARRRMLVSVLVAVAAVAGAMIVLVSVDVSVAPGAGLGVLIGLVLLAPYRRVLRDLGLSTTEAGAILDAERDRRTGVAALSPQQRAARETIRSRVFLVVGLVMVVAFCVAGSYFADNAGKTTDESAPDNPWFGISALTAAVTLCLTPWFLWMARARRSAAKQMLAAADDDRPRADR
jgi:hypothetical protein